MRRPRTVPRVEGMEARTVLSGGTLAAHIDALAIHAAHLRALAAQAHATTPAPAPHHAPAPAPAPAPTPTPGPTPVYILPPWVHLAVWTPPPGTRGG